MVQMILARRPGAQADRCCGIGKAPEAGTGLVFLNESPNWMRWYTGCELFYLLQPIAAGGRSSGAWVLRFLLYDP
jgi:hypothetical protein